MKETIKEIAAEVVTNAKTVTGVSAGLSAPLWVQHIETFNIIMASVIAASTAFYAILRGIDFYYEFTQNRWEDRKRRMDEERLKYVSSRRSSDDA